MRTTFENGFRHLTYLFQLELTLHEKFGRDLGALLLSFLKEEPRPFIWEVPRPVPCPWDPLVFDDPLGLVGLPLFAP